MCQIFEYLSEKLTTAFQSCVRTKMFWIWDSVGSVQAFPMSSCPHKDVTIKNFELPKWPIFVKNVIGDKKMLKLFWRLVDISTVTGSCLISNFRANLLLSIWCIISIIVNHVSIKVQMSLRTCQLDLWLQLVSQNVLRSVRYCWYFTWILSENCITSEFMDRFS